MESLHAVPVADAGDDNVAYDMPANYGAHLTTGSGLTFESKMWVDDEGRTHLIVRTVRS